MRFYIIFYKLLIKEQDNALLIAENRCRTVQLYTYFQDLKKKTLKNMKGVYRCPLYNQVSKTVAFFAKKTFVIKEA